LKPEAVALAFALATMVSTLALYLEAWGWPSSYLTLAVAILHGALSSGLYFNMRNSRPSVVAGSALAAAYVALATLHAPNFVAYIALLCDLASGTAAAYALLRPRRTEHPTPLDLPVYG
jgi:hypothetical protein